MKAIIQWEAFQNNILRRILGRPQHISVLIEGGSRITCNLEQRIRTAFNKIRNWFLMYRSLGLPHKLAVGKLSSGDTIVLMILLSTMYAFHFNTYRTYYRTYIYTYIVKMHWNLENLAKSNEIARKNQFLATYIFYFIFAAVT